MIGCFAPMCQYNAGDVLTHKHLGAGTIVEVSPDGIRFTVR